MLLAKFDRFIFSEDVQLGDLTDAFTVLELVGLALRRRWGRCSGQDSTASRPNRCMRIVASRSTGRQSWHRASRMLASTASLCDRRVGLCDDACGSAASARRGAVDRG